MPVQTQVVRFTKDATNVDNATQDVALTFTPKAIIVFSDCFTADNTASAHYQWCTGFSDGTTHNCLTITSDDADAAADTQTLHSASIYARMLETTNETTEERATCAFITNGVRFTWVTNSADATRLVMWAIGGSDITHAKVGSKAVGTTTTGIVDYTGLGFNAFAGNAALFTLSSFFGAPGNVSASTATGHFGCATSVSTFQWAVGQVMEDVVPDSDTWRVTYNNHCLIQLNATDGTLGYSAAFNGFITDGFQLNWTDAPAFSTYEFGYLVIKGGNWEAGTLTSPATPTNNVDQAIGPLFKPIRGLLMAGTGTAASGTIGTVAAVTVGATDGTIQAAIGAIDEDAQATMDSYRINTTASIVRLLTTNGAAQYTAAIDSLSTDNFRLDWSAAPSGALFCYVVVADETDAAAAVEAAVPKAFGDTNLKFLKQSGGQGTIFG